MKKIWKNGIIKVTNIGGIIVKYLIFEVDNEKFVINIKNVKEIILNNKEIVPMPLSNPSQLGIMQLREDIIDVFSVARLLNKRKTKEENILILENNIGLSVDKVFSIKDDSKLNETEIEMNKDLKNTLVKKAFKDKDSNEIYIEFDEEKLTNF